MWREYGEKKGLLPFKRKKGGKRFNTEVYEILGGARKAIADEEIQDRLALAMINEAALCQEGTYCSGDCQGLFKDLFRYSMCSTIASRAFSASFDAMA